MNPKLQYVVVEVHALFEDVSTTPGDVKKRFGNVLKEQKKPFLIVASDLLSTLEGKWGVKLHVKKILMGSDLENYRLQTEIKTLNCIMFFRVMSCKFNSIIDYCLCDCPRQNNLRNHKSLL